ncbi:MAG: 4Fe-4S binding protein [Paracoccaceae bacterium]
MFDAAQPPAFRATNPSRLARAGDWLRRHQTAIRRLQWGVVAIYGVLLVGPNLLPLPDRAAHVWNDLTLFAQFVFWGIWWPGVLLSMLVFGRLWCGLFCPEGALTEAASRHGIGRAVPRWMRWQGWPFAAFVMTTVYGQMVSVYQYPGPALVVLGGSTVAAVVVGWLYGRNHRVWCRYLCPVSGVFGLLAKLAPMHYAANPAAWAATPAKAGRTTAVNCAPLVVLKGLDSASPCHMCGRCAGFRDAIELRGRKPGAEVVASAGKATVWDSLLILTGLMGVATGAFLWASSPWFIALKLWLADRLVNAGVLWPLEARMPWWVLTDYPDRNDVMTLLDGVAMLGFIGGTAVAMTLALGLPLALAARIGGTGLWSRLHHLALGLLPLAAAGVILGLSAQTVTLLRADGFRLLWVPEARLAVLALAAGWSLLLFWQVAGRHVAGVRRAAMSAAASLSIAVALVPWHLLFQVW